MSTALFQAERPRLLALAYRLTGSRADAEDLVQEAWLRWQGHEAEADNAPAYLARIVVNLGMDRWRRLKQEREHYTGPWLPEPWPAEPEVAGPEQGHETRRLLGTAWLVLLEKLNPLERAVFVLREAFDYSFAEIATVVDRSEAHCRQLDRRARQHLQDDGLRVENNRPQQEKLLQRFLAALEAGELALVNQLFSDDVRLYSDGGGKVIAALRVLHGLARVRDFFIAVIKNNPVKLLRAEIRELEGEPVICYWFGGVLAGMTTIASAEGRITAVFTLRNPDKLAAVQAQWGNS